MLFTNKSTFWLLKSPLTFIILTVFMKESGGENKCAISKFECMIRINVTIEVKSEVRAQVMELLREMSELSRQEKGCIRCV